RFPYPTLFRSLSCSIAAGRYTSALTTITFFLRLSFRCRASLPTVVVLPAPCRPAIRIIAGAGTLRLRSLAAEPITAASSSRTTLIRAWPGVSDFSTSWPTARTLIRCTSACTTGRATSASSRAMRTSRTASPMLDSVNRPRPRRRSMVPDRRWVSDSNMRARKPGQRPSIIAVGCTIPLHRTVCDTRRMTIVLIAVAAYLAAALLLLGAVARARLPGARGWAVPALLGVALHASYHLVVAWRITGGADMHFFSALSLVSLGMAALTATVGARERMAALGVFAFPLAALLLAVYAYMGHAPSPPLDWRLQLHALLGLLAYAALAIAALRARVLWLQRRALRRREFHAWLRALQPLTGLDTVLYRTITVGFVLLPLNFLTGVLFVEDQLSPHLVHKT